MSKSPMTAEKDIKFQFQLQKCAFELCLISPSPKFDFLSVVFSFLSRLCAKLTWLKNHDGGLMWTMQDLITIMATIQIELLKYKAHVGCVCVCVLCNPIYVAYVCVVQVMYCNSGENKYHICLRGETE